MAKILDPDLLSYSVNSATNNVRFNTTAKTIQLVASGSLVAVDGVTGQCLYSKIKEAIKADAELIKYPLPVSEMIHDESMELINGWTFADETTIKMIRDCGVAYVNAAKATTAMYACIVTLGTVVNGAPYYVQDSTTNAATAAFTHVVTGGTFSINELVQIYSDPNGDGSVVDGYDKRAYFKVFLRTGGYTYSESSNADIGYPALTYKKYNFPITHAVDAGVTETDGTVSAYTGMGITWYAVAQSVSGQVGGPFDYHVIMNANGKTAAQMYSWVQWKLRQSSDIDDGAGTRNGNVAASLVLMDGSTLKTRYQTAVGGVHVSNPSATSLNDIKEYDDTNALRSYPYVAAIALEFDSFLVSDGANAKFWLFPTSTYGTAGATPIVDKDSIPITGTITGATMSFSHTWTVDIPFTGVAVGKGNAKIAIATGTLSQSTANKAVFVAGQERWYANPV